MNTKNENLVKTELSKKHAELLVNLFSDIVISCNVNIDMHITRQSSRIIINLKKHKAYFKINISASVSYTAGILINNADYNKTTSLYYNYNINTDFEDLMNHMRSDFTKLLSYYNTNNIKLLTPISYVDNINS